MQTSLFPVRDFPQSLELVKGSLTKIAPIVSTDKSAKVILKYWDRKYKRIPDLLVIEDPKAGGHLGFTKEQLEIFDEETYRSEVQAILKTVQGYGEQYGKKIPVARPEASTRGRKWKLPWLSV